MAGIVELKAMIKDNPEASEIVSAIESTMTSNTEKIMDLEKQVRTSADSLTEAIQSRDKVKDTIKSELGLNEFSPDAIRAKLASFGNEEALAARDAQFNDLRASTAAKIEALENKETEYKQGMNDLRLKLAIAQTDVMGQTKGEHATEMLLNWIAEDAVFDENGNIQYKGPSGETLYNENSNPLTLEDRINQIKGDESRDFVFQSRFLNGGGAPTERIIDGPAGPASGGTFTRTTMNAQEKIEYANKYGKEAYDKLPLI